MAHRKRITLRDSVYVCAGSPVYVHERLSQARAVLLSSSWEVGHAAYEDHAARRSLSRSKAG